MSRAQIVLVKLQTGVPSVVSNCLSCSEVDKQFQLVNDVPYFKNIDVDRQTNEKIHKLLIFCLCSNH